MAGVRLPTHNTLKTTKMVQEKQLRELFKYIEQKWDIAVEESHKTDIKRIFGGVLCEDIMKETEPTEQPAQPSSQAKLDNSFDKERFEAMFQAVLASGKNVDWEEDFRQTELALKKLDAYYATKQGGTNE